MNREQQPRYADNNYHVLTYENFSPLCPYCSKRKTFNRADDFGTFRPIGHRLVVCQHDDCQREFHINADLVNAKHEYLILDCLYLLEKKRYMYCILNLCQACEAYFSLFIRSKTVFESIENRLFETHAQLNNCNQQLESKLKRQSYYRLRNIFLNLFLDPPDVYSLRDLNNLINALSSDRFINAPPRDNLDDIGLDELGNLFKDLYNFDINEVRNKVVHNTAYRPDREMVEHYCDQTRAIIFGIDRHLRIRDNIEQYFPPGYRLL